FEVEKNKNKPFVVETPHYDVMVKGTSFNIMAYEDINKTETSLVTGEVTIRNIKNGKHKKDITLKAGEKMIFNKEDHSLNIENANVEREMAWKNNLFMFSETKFEELCKRLERWYDVDVTVADEDLKEIRYTGKFRNEETIWQVLDIIKITTPIEYELEDRKVTIYKD
ncbi:MAG: FecR family protein, partial [Bacteroidota bacterium]